MRAMRVRRSNDWWVAGWIDRWIRRSGQGNRHLVFGELWISLYLLFFSIMEHRVSAWSFIAFTWVENVAIWSIPRTAIKRQVLLLLLSCCSSIFQILRTCRNVRSRNNMQLRNLGLFNSMMSSPHRKFDFWRWLKVPISRGWPSAWYQGIQSTSPARLTNDRIMTNTNNHQQRPGSPFFSPAAQRALFSLCLPIACGDSEWSYALDTRSFPRNYPWDMT